MEVRSRTTLTLILSPRRGNSIQTSLDIPKRPGRSGRGRSFSLSPGERAGVRVSVQFLTPPSAFRIGIVRQLHDVIKISGAVIAPDVQDIHLAFMQTRNRLELLDAFKLPIVRPIVLEPVPVNHFNGPVVAQYVSRQPHFAVAAAAGA